MDERSSFEWVPSPLAIALGLTFFTAAMAWIAGSSIEEVAQAWHGGLWNRPLIVFAFQAMFMLVLGHALALSPLACRAIDCVVSWTGNTTSRAAATVALVACSTAWLNWGLGLIVGAVLARKVGERAARDGRRLNYGLIGASGYTGLMVWHGGLSGSAPIKVAEPGHLADMASLAGLNPAAMPSTIPLADTVFSAGNLGLTVLLIGAITATAWWLGRRKPGDSTPLPEPLELNAPTQKQSNLLARISPLAAVAGALVLALSVGEAVQHPDALRLGFITPDWTNQVLLATALLLHGKLARFLAATQEAIGGATGILIQFPLYFGIMGLLTGTGLAHNISSALIDIAGPNSFEWITMCSAGLVNIFVPSGGGQWAVQGPVLIAAAAELGIPLKSAIMAMAYGDELTNMLQPFWALPLLGITGLQARDILPYTLVFMAVGAVIFSTFLLG
jgi:short-chain fatty acids transporter